MSDFNSQIEVLRALLDGKEIYQIYSGTDALIVRYKVIDGGIAFSSDDWESWQYTDHNNFYAYYRYRIFVPNDYRYTMCLAIKTSELLSDEVIFMLQDDLSGIIDRVSLGTKAKEVMVKEVVLATGVKA